MAWQTTGSENVAAILKITPGGILATSNSLPGKEHEMEILPAASTNGSTSDKNVSVYLDTPDKTMTDTTSDSSVTMQTEGEATQMQQSDKEAMDTAREISHALIWHLFAQDNDEQEDRDAALFCIEYEHQIYTYLHKLEVSGHVQSDVQEVDTVSA